MSFAENLQAVRKERKITQEDLAELLNVSRQAVSKWEQGTGYPEVEKLIVLAKVLNVSLDYLVSDSSDDLNSSQSQRNFTGKILIKSYDGKRIVNCYKVLSFSINNSLFKNKKDEPSFALYRVDEASFWGENRVLLGWYTDEESIKKEMDLIYSALEQGKTSYELSYAAKVKEGFLSVKLEE